MVAAAVVLVKLLALLTGGLIGILAGLLTPGTGEGDRLLLI